jgi:hypothetical protein
MPGLCVFCSVVDIAEVHRAPLAVGHASVVHYLPQRILDLWMGLFDFVKENHPIGTTPHRFSQLQRRIGITDFEVLVRQAIRPQSFQNRSAPPNQPYSLASHSTSEISINTFLTSLVYNGPVFISGSNGFVLESSIAIENGKNMRKALLFIVIIVFAGGCAGSNGATPGNTTTPPQQNADLSGVITFRMEAWADNWFAAYLDDKLIVEDSVPISTERSFNAETVEFVANYPLHLNFVLKDFKENDTGLEYIGARNQQMGDGGFILQLTDTASGQVVAVSNTAWACTVIHTAPLDKACEKEANPLAGTAPCAFTALGEPDGWRSAAFDDSGWTATTAHSAQAVSPKDGYDQIHWDASAQLIWGPDLETDNTILCRVTVNAP